MNSVLVTTQLIYSRRRIIKLITIRSGLEEELLCNPSAKSLTMNLPEYSSICVNDHPHQLMGSVWNQTLSKYPHTSLCAGGKSLVYHVQAVVHGGCIFN